MPKIQSLIDQFFLIMHSYFAQQDLLHSAYQHFVTNTQFHLDEQPYASPFKIYKKEFLDVSVSKNLFHPDSLALASDGTPVVTSHRERKKRICDCKENGITNCKCNRYFSQPDCDIGWDSSRSCWYHGYDLYMLIDSQSDLPVFPHSLVPQLMIHMVFYRHFLE